MHAIVPVAGKGTRMRPHTWSRPKPLLGVAGKPMLAHILDDLVEAGLKKISLVVGYRGDEIERWAVERYGGRAEIYCQRQETMDGLASAIALAEPNVGEEKAFVVLGDTIFRADLEGLLRSRRNMICAMKVEDPRRFGVVVMEDDRVVRLVEKPREFVSDLAIVGLYLFQSAPRLMSAIHALVESGKRTRGEFQLTDAMQIMLERGEEFGTFEIDGWYDCGKPETLLQTNRDLLERAGGARRATEDGAVIIEPVHLEAGAVIRRSVVGPAVSVARDAVVEDSVVSNSILDAGCRVSGARLDGSIVGMRAEVRGRAAGLSVGDDSVVELG
ncbi:MAG: sugar phosphate nucleotidyltransferase [Candidatus Fermentibacterota bacterium]